MPSRIYLDKGHSLTVDEDFNAVEGALRQAPPGPTAVVILNRKDKKVLVNAATVRHVEEVRARTGRVVAVGG